MTDRKNTDRFNSRVKPNKGFTLIEVLLTVAILAFGIVSIYEALFMSVDTYGYYTHYLNTQDWVSEKFSDVQDELIRTRQLYEERTTGHFIRDHKKYSWTMNVIQLDDEQGLYKVDIFLSWKEGGKKVSISRETYLLNPELKIYGEKSV